MKRDHHQPASRLKRFKQTVLQRLFQMLQLAIDRDPQCLKDPRGRVFASLVTNRRGQGRVDRIDQIGSRANRRSRSLPHDLFGNRSTEAFFAVLVKDVCECLRRGTHQQFGGRFALSHIEPHIERPCCAEPEAALAIRQLIRRQTQVDDDAIDRWDSARQGRSICGSM